MKLTPLDACLPRYLRDVALLGFFVQSHIKVKIIHEDLSSVIEAAENSEEAPPFYGLMKLYILDRFEDAYNLPSKEEVEFMLDDYFVSRDMEF